MATEGREQKLLFQDHGNRTVEAAFDGGMITSDGGALLLRELELKQHIVSDFARYLQFRILLSQASQSLQSPLSSTISRFHSFAGLHIIR
jgi:hypothetical protein